MGAPLGLCSPDFRARFERAALIIAKGQANDETLSGLDAPLCFLLQAKCAVIAEDIGVAPGSVIIAANDRLRTTEGSALTATDNQRTRITAGE